ncbi:DUF625-domain-containing protein [Xylariaceae sp. FL1019]|nr:DUF625-domain-containing protein [Xylariaceae sp. FL1019]
MAAQPVPHPSTERRRVKVYELRNNDWFDRGTGFCSAVYNNTEDVQQRDPRVVVESEDQPDRILLETRICKEDGFHKQQETLIVWTEPNNGVDMALSFQEAEGCAMIWKFINSIQQQYNPSNTQDDSEIDDLAIDMPNPISLPEASLANLADIESSMRSLSGTQGGRDALTKYVLSERYIDKLIPIVSDAEDLESLSDLHRLCNIMKIIILLNDTNIIEQAVSDECVIGVVGALEYDPDFPSHKANHRQWLQGGGRFREVVPIEDGQILKKIHQTYRLGYLKDVVLARILDDNTFSVLNSLIFFNQVDIVQHLQGNIAFLGELFNIFKSGQDPTRKKEAVLFIEQCCSIAKNLQPPSRQTLYNNCIAHGLLGVINFGLKHNDVAVRVGATNILVCIIEHDPHVIRQTMYRQVHDKQSPLTETLIDLLLVETDLGVKSHISDALKVLLDQSPIPAEAFAKANGEYATRAAMRSAQASIDPQQDLFLAIFYEKSAVKLFQPLIALKGRKDMQFTNIEANAFTYLVEILCFFIRQHQYRSKNFVLSQDLVLRITQLLQSPEKFLKLVGVRFLRQLVGSQDEFYIKHLSEKKALEPVIDLLITTMPRDNLLSSACLELFEHIKKENVKDLVKHMVENYREKLQTLAYMDVFREILLRYDQTAGFTANMDYFLESEDEAGRRRPNINPRTTGPMEHLTMDQAEEEYWNTSDDEDELQGKTTEGSSSMNGETTGHKLMVDYASDEDLDENVEAGAISADEEGTQDKAQKTDATPAVAPPERLSEKRRREEDEEDDLSKMIQHKRRNSTSAGSNASVPTSSVLRKKKAGAGTREASIAPKKIAISLTSTGKAGGHSGDD